MIQNLNRFAGNIRKINTLPIREVKFLVNINSNAFRIPFSGSCIYTEVGIDSRYVIAEGDERSIR